MQQKNACEYYFSGKRRLNHDSQAKLGRKPSGLTRKITNSEGLCILAIRQKLNYRPLDMPLYQPSAADSVAKLPESFAFARHRRMKDAQT